MAAWISLVLITGITAFMLNPGGWPAQPRLLDGLLQSAVPAADDRPHRRGAAADSLYVYLHASLTVKPPQAATG